MSVATVVGGRLELFSDAGEASRTQDVANSQPPGGNPLVLIVEEARGEWLRVRLPVYPNGTTAWVRRSAVMITSHTYSIAITIGTRRITVRQGSSVVHDEVIGLGQGCPLEPGKYFTVALIAVPASQDLGPFSYVLSGYDDAHGGVGIHGGTDSSRSCIRLSDDGITKLRSTLPLGVPVDIQP